VYWGAIQDDQQLPTEMAPEVLDELDYEWSTYGTGADLKIEASLRDARND